MCPVVRAARPRRPRLLGAAAAHDARRRPSAIDGVRARVVRREAPTPPLEVGPIGEFLFEPDGAIIRADLLDVAAADLGAHQIDPTIAYLTGDTPLPSETTPASADIPLATCYRVQDVLPQNVKHLKTYLRQRGVGRVTIKKRGTDVTPEKLRAQLALRGEDETTLVLTRIAGHHKAIVVEPVDSALPRGPQNDGIIPK